MSKSFLYVEINLIADSVISGLFIVINLFITKNPNKSFTSVYALKRDSIATL